SVQFATGALRAAAGCRSTAHASLRAGAARRRPRSWRRGRRGGGLMATAPAPRPRAPQRADPPLLAVADTLSRRLARLRFGPPVAHVYHPLQYAREPYRAYVGRYGGAPREVLLVGMNPGPFGMAQTGVPFGEIAMVRDWMGIDAPVDKPAREHPKRPIDGFACTRSEVSGARLWGWARDRFGTPDAFFARFFVWNYCPLC